MREIKFRIWDKSLKYMRYLASHHDTLMFDEKGAHYYNLQNGDGNSFEDSGYSELMQYTGLKDKNGVEIYEGDIVIVAYSDIQCGDSIETREVTWDDNSYGYSPLNWEFICDECDCYTAITSIEVIGNIFENKELLEG